MIGKCLDTYGWMPRLNTDFRHNKNKRFHEMADQWTHNCRMEEMAMDTQLQNGGDGNGHTTAE